MKRLKQIWNSEPGWLYRTEIIVSALGMGMVVLTLMEENPVRDFSFYKGLAAVFILYAVCLVMNYMIAPALIRGESITLNSVVTVAFFAAPAAILGDLYLGPISFIAFLAYTGVRYTAIYLWRNADAIHARYRYISPGILLASVLWLLSSLFLWMNDADIIDIILWATLIPIGIALFSYSFYQLIPSSLSNKRPFLSFAFKAATILVIISFPLGFLVFFLTNQEDPPMAIPVVNFFLHMLVTVPFSWMLYKRFSKGREELQSLQKELGQSLAGFDFLRSQINPHFLFNVLNSLYGLAIQENASRTSEGIQRLGDMMRFMLQENMQEKIPLAREVEYLQNYIALQSLRVGNHAGIEIKTDIPEVLTLGSVPPMLLIPFVENAFKHGISFRERSFISINLAVTDGVLNFSVDNGQHPLTKDDPEKQKSGIGLTNVKQRLELFFPGTHQLTIRDTINTFSIKLSIPVSLQPS
ncbi:MAG: histidine kinase [Cyclobacteriaceae bacterium]|nr:histidine kinase [Cyclobacteriaceae bacterium]